MALSTPVLAAMLGGAEVWIIVLAIVVLIWGPSKLPSLARGLGQSIKEFKKASREIEEEVKPGEAKKAEPQDASKPGSN
jgi:sec-independent protein translocase protein TatA